MAQRIYPSWEQIDNYKKPLSNEERLLLRHLDSALPRDMRWDEERGIAEYDGWMIFSRPFLDGYQPDIVIFHPFVGMVIYDFYRDDVLKYAYEKDNADDPASRWVFRNRTSKEKALLPYKRVEDIVDFFKGNLMPEIGEAFARSAIRSQSPVIGVTVFTNNTWDEVDSVLLSTEKKTSVPKWILLPGKEYLQFVDAADLIPSAFSSDKLFKWDHAWSLEAINWIKPPLHTIEHATFLSLRGNQLKVATPSPGHHRVRGVAGSGKTQALAYRAAQLAAMGYDVLVLSFNITMWHFMKDMIDRAPFEFEWSKITFNHFHGFCNRILRQFHKPWPSASDGGDGETDELFATIVPNAVRSAISGEEYRKYDAILIDEGQDFQFAWYSLLSDCFLSERDEVVVVCDKKQNIYRCDNTWLDRRVTRTGMDKFNQPFIDLKRTYRLPAPIALMANDFAKTFGLNSDLPISDEFEQMLFEDQECHIEWKSWSDVSKSRTPGLSPEEEEQVQQSEEREKAKVCRRLFSWYENLNGRYGNPSDIVILVTDHKWGRTIADYFKEKNVDSNNIFSNSGRGKKVSFNMEDPRVKICTVHSFKGWEMKNVLLFIPGKLPASATEQNVRVSDANGEPCINMDALLYTAITRVKQNLVVFNEYPRYKAFGKKYKKKLPFQIIDDQSDDEN